MWSKRNRLAICSVIYQHIFWESLVQEGLVEPNFDVDLLNEILSGEETDIINDKVVKEAETYFMVHREEIWSKLAPYMDQWEKTFDIVKAVLYTYILESELFGVENVKVGKYIKITQDLIAGGSTSLVHAILSKITGHNIELLDESQKN